MKKLLTTTTITLAMIGVPGIAAATDDAQSCADGYTAVDSKGGPLCVGDIYVENDDVFKNDLTLCKFGVYQGACLSDPASFTDEPEQGEPETRQESAPIEDVVPPQQTTADDPPLDPSISRLIEALISLLSW